MLSAMIGIRWGLMTSHRMALQDASPSQRLTVLRLRWPVSTGSCEFKGSSKCVRLNRWSKLDDSLLPLEVRAQVPAFQFAGILVYRANFSCRRDSSVSIQTPIQRPASTRQTQITRRLYVPPPVSRLASFPMGHGNPRMLMLAMAHSPSPSVVACRRLPVSGSLR